MPRYDFCLCMGRFQPFHLGHLDLVQASLARGKRAIILLGSHLSAPTIRNPWSAKERAQMIQRCLSPTEQERVDIVPICDRNTNEKWASTIHSEVYRIADLRHTIAIIGHHDGGQAFFSQWFPQWHYVEKLRRPHLNATGIRADYFGGFPEHHYCDKLPPGTLQYLREFKLQPTYQQLCSQYYTG